jgi:dihydroorotase
LYSFECVLVSVAVCIQITDPETDLFDREALFIEQVLKPLLKTVPKLRVIMEHITTAEAAEFVSSAGSNARFNATASSVSSPSLLSLSLSLALSLVRSLGFTFLQRVLLVGANVAATITAHHLLFNRNAIFKGGVNPHYYCLPVRRCCCS